MKRLTALVFCVVTMLLLITGCVLFNQMIDDAIDASVPNSEPIALLTWEPEYISGIGFVRFDASLSFDPDGDSITYLWSGWNITKNRSISSSLQKYNAVIYWEVLSDYAYYFPGIHGEYRFTVTVTDTFGASDSDSVWIYIDETGIYDAH